MTNIPTLIFNEIVVERSSYIYIYIYTILRGVDAKQPFLTI